MTDHRFRAARPSPALRDGAEPDAPASAPPTMVAVVGASGGLGASSLALALARRAAAGPGAVVVDLDLARGGLDVTAGIEHRPGARWPALAAVDGAVDGEALLRRLPAQRDVAVLSAVVGTDAAPRPPLPEGVGGGRRGSTVVRAETVLAALDALAASGRSVVVDLPVGSPVFAEVCVRCDVVVVLTALWTRALADLDAVVEAVVGAGEQHDCPGPAIRLVTTGARPSRALLEDLERHTGCAHAGHVPREDRVARAAERGEWPGTGDRDLARLCDRLLVPVSGMRDPGAGWEVAS